MGRQLGQVLVKAWGPEPHLQDPCKKCGMVMYTCNPSGGKAKADILGKQRHADP